MASLAISMHVAAQTCTSLSCTLDETGTGRVYPAAWFVIP